MILRIGNRLSRAVNTLAEASAVYCAARDASGEGGSTFPVGRLPGHYISYNGKIWAGSPANWKIGDSPVYSPYE